jgi:hypothetical protein
MTVVIEGTEYLSAAEVAGKLCTTELKVLMLLRQKALCGHQIDGTWFVTAESLASYDPNSVAPASPACRTSCSGSSCGCK